MSDSVQPHRRQPTRLPRPWDSPGKNTGVGCHFLLQCMKVKSQSEVAQSCPTPSDPRDCSLPGSSIHGVFQARVLEWGAIAFSDFMHSVRHMLILIRPPLSSPWCLYILFSSLCFCFCFVNQKMRRCEFVLCEGHAFSTGGGWGCLMGILSGRRCGQGRHTAELLRPQLSEGCSISSAHSPPPPS